MARRPPERSRPRGRPASSPGDALSELAGAGAETGPVRQPLGESGAGWVALDLGPDRMTATLTELCYGGDASLGPAQVRAAVEALGVVHGVQDDELLRLATLAGNDRRRPVRGQFVVARGTPGGGDGDDEAVVGLAPAQPLREALAQPTLEQVLAADPEGTLVSPGQVLVRRTGGDAGLDIFGSPLAAADRRRLGAGLNVRAVDGGLEAAVYGFACIADRTVMVLPPLWVSPDAMAAHWVRFRRTPAPPTPQSAWVMALLEAAGISRGIDEAALEALCGGTGDGRARAVRLAAGQPCVQGVDAHLAFAIDLGKRSGTVLEDGSIDLRQRNASVAVAADQLLARAVAATAGVAGWDLRGTELPARDGEAREFGPGLNVRTATGDGAVQFFAEVDGAASLKNDEIQVLPVVAVGGDVNYETGNIQTKGEVTVSGSVCSGFRVEAGGSITVGGVVEDGAELRAGGDVVVARGIIGETTRIVARGAVHSRYIQNSTVMAQGDVVVGSYIYNAHVRAGGSIQVQAAGGPRAGSIVGGEIVAAVGIEAATIGSPTTDRTLVGIGADPESAARLQRARRTLAATDGQVARLLRTLGIEEPRAELIKERIRRALPAHRKILADTVRKLHELLSRRQETVAEQDAVLQEIATHIAEGEVRASKKAYAEVLVTFGDEESRIPEDIAGPIFYLTEEGIRYRLF